MLPAQVIKGAAALHLSKADVKFAEVPYLPTINDPRLTGAVSRVARQLLHETHRDAVEADSKFWDLPPPTATMGAGDCYNCWLHHWMEVNLGVTYVPGAMSRLHCRQHMYWHSYDVIPCQMVWIWTLLKAKNTPLALFGCRGLLIPSRCCAWRIYVPWHPK